MRAHLVITFIMFASLFYCEQSFSTCKNVSVINYSQNVLEDGTYSAIVEYYNPKTYQNSRYQLQVTVSSDRVIAIHFGNGGSLHSGSNNSEYRYQGGVLSFSTDYNGNITSAQASVSIYYSNTNSTTTYKIIIQ